MAEWLGTGLQNRAQQFDSAWYLHKETESPMTRSLFSLPLTGLIYIITSLVQAQVLPPPRPCFPFSIWKTSTDVLRDITRHVRHPRPGAGGSLKEAAPF